MNNLAINDLSSHSTTVFSAYDDEFKPGELSSQIRKQNVDLVIQRFFVGKIHDVNFECEAIARHINPSEDFVEKLLEEEEEVSDGFAPELLAPSTMVEEVFYEYAKTELGAVVLARLLAWDAQFINIGWRNIDGSLTEEGIYAYGEGKWRPFRVASNDEDSDIVTQSGALVLPDKFHEEYYSTGDVSNPLAILHHEIKAHVLPLKDGENLVPGPELELICVRLESEMLRELGLPERRLNWGGEDGTLNHTLHESSERYFHGLVRYDGNGKLVEIDPESKFTIGVARVET